MVSYSRINFLNVGSHYLLTSGSSAVNGCHQNESSNSWYKHHKQHNTIPVNKLTFCEVKSCVFEGNISHFEVILTLNCHFWPKYQSIINNSNYSSEKSQIRVYYKHSSFQFTLMDWIYGHVCCLWIIAMFLSAIWTLILTAPIHCRGSICEQVMQCNAMQSLSKSNLMKKQTLIGWVNIFLENLHFWVNHSFNSISTISTLGVKQRV